MFPVAPPSMHQYPTSPSPQGPSINNEGHDTNYGLEWERALEYLASQTNAGGTDTSNTGAVADAQGLLRCMLSTRISQFGEHIVPCCKVVADLEELMVHIWDEHGLRGPDSMRLDCNWLDNGNHLCGENVRKGGYKRHVSTHLRLKFACPHQQCGKEYSRIDTLRKHMTKRHG